MSLNRFNFEIDAAGKFAALDNLRDYFFHSAIRGFVHDDNTHNRIASELSDYFEGHETVYEDCPSAFKQNMETVAAILQEHGL